MSRLSVTSATWSGDVTTRCAGADPLSTGVKSSTRRPSSALHARRAASAFGAVTQAHPVRWHFSLTPSLMRVQSNGANAACSAALKPCVDAASGKPLKKSVTGPDRHRRRCSQASVARNAAKAASCEAGDEFIARLHKTILAVPETVLTPLVQSMKRRCIALEAAGGKDFEE